MISASIVCQDKYESQKLASLIFVKDGYETFITEILNVFDNEVVFSIKDKSAHSVLLRDKDQVDVFIDFIQSIVDKEHKIIAREMITMTASIQEDLKKTFPKKDVFEKFNCAVCHVGNAKPEWVEPH